MGNNEIIIILILLIVGAFLFINIQQEIPSEEFQSTSGNLIRTVPINGNGNFYVEYKSEIGGRWVAVIVDKVSSNCKFSNGKSEYKTVIIGEGKTSQTIKVSGTNCVFDGDYDFYSSYIQEKLIKFGKQTVK